MCVSNFVGFGRCTLVTIHLDEEELRDIESALRWRIKRAKQLNDGEPTRRWEDLSWKFEKARLDQIVMKQEER